MKRIRVLTEFPVVINKLTVDRDHPMDVWNEELLKSQEVRALLEARTIEIVDDASPDVDQGVRTP
jgi:hypothetical protein